MNEALTQLNSLDYQKCVVICCFNGFWPSDFTLRAWVHQNWTQNLEFLFYSKGYFVVIFKDLEDRHMVFDQGP